MVGPCTGAPVTSTDSCAIDAMHRCNNRQARCVHAGPEPAVRLVTSWACRLSGAAKWIHAVAHSRPAPNPPGTSRTFLASVKVVGADVH